MPDTLIEPPPKADAIVKSAGDKFREAFAKIDPPPEDPKQQTPVPTEAPSSPAADAAPHAQPAAASPSSALEAAIGPTKDETNPELDETEFDKVETPTKDNWHQARTRIKELNTKVKELSAQPQTTPDTSALEAITEERDGLKQRLADQENRLKSINAEYSEEYQSLQKDREKAVRKIATRMKYIGASEKASDLVDALNLPDSRFKTQQIKEALSELESDDKAAIRVLIEGLDTVDEKITDFKKDLPAQWERIQSDHSRRQADEEAEGLKAIDREFGKVIVELPKEIVRLRKVPDDTPGAADWNKPIDEAIRRANALLKPNGSDFPYTLKTAVKGELFDEVWKDYVAVWKENQELRKRGAELDAAGPDFKGGKKPTTEVKKTPSQKFHEALAAQQATSPE